MLPGRCLPRFHVSLVHRTRMIQYKPDYKSERSVSQWQGLVHQQEWSQHRLPLEDRFKLRPENESLILA